MRLIAWWDQQRISSAKIMVVGAGALGNEVLKNLALLGVGTIHIVDYDQVQPSNLTRSVLFRQQHTGMNKATVAASMARELNPDCQLIVHDADIIHDIGLGIIREMDVVIGCLDNREARLWVNRMCFKANTPWIDGGIQEINGVAKVFRPPAGPCYECTMTENDYRLIALRYSCPMLKQEDIQQGRTPTAPTIASIVGGLQVQEALKLLHEMPGAEGSALVFNGVANQFYKTKFALRDDCLSHETFAEIGSLDLSANDTARELFDSIRAHLHLKNDSQFTLVLDRDYLQSLVCRSCEFTQPIGRPRFQVKQSEGLCSSCQQPMQPVSVCEIGMDTPLSDAPMRQLGVPDRDIVRVRHDQNDHFFELASIAERAAETSCAR
jgi:adenylyltransferase/sulfurtransferase